MLKMDCNDFIIALVKVGTNYITNILLGNFHFAVFKELVTTEIKNNSKIAVIATSKCHDSLHPSLLTSRGCHIFRCCVELHPPDANRRQEILCAMMKTRFSKTDSCDVEFRCVCTRCNIILIYDWYCCDNNLMMMIIIIIIIIIIIVMLMIIFCWSLLSMKSNDNMEK